MSEVTADLAVGPVGAPPETEETTRTFRVLRRDTDTPGSANATRWIEEDAISTVYIPDATEVGEKYGEGDYLLIEVASKYSFHSTYLMTVVAERRYRLASEEEA